MHENQTNFKEETSDNFTKKEVCTVKHDKLHLSNYRDVITVVILNRECVYPILFQFIKNPQDNICKNSSGYVQHHLKEKK